MNVLMISPVVSSYVHDYHFIFIVALLSLAALILLRSRIALVIQLALFVAMLLTSPTDFTFILNILIVVQIGITLYMLYRFKKAIDRNYRLVLEKTYAINRSLTKNDYLGSKSSFFL